MRRALIALLLATTLVPVVEARTVLLPSKQKSASLASVVATVEITKSTPLLVGKAECAYEYEAKLLSVKKGALPRTTSFRFGVLGGLEVGRTYVVYLRNLETKSEFVRLMEERNDDLDAVRPIIEACPVVPPILMFFRADRATNE
jgi:hypothetical protein